MEHSSSATKTAEKSITEKISFERLAFISFGVSIEILYQTGVFAEGEILESFRRIFPYGFERLGADAPAKHSFELYLDETDEGGEPLFLYKIAKDRTFLYAALTGELLFDYLVSSVRLTIAEFAAGKVFLHAGVVGWKGRAIVFPGRSYHGKTTLTAALIKKGAEYFSDEYAVLDEQGLAYPFPKMLSVRGIRGDFEQVDLPIERFNGKVASKPLPVGMLLFAEYQKNALWHPLPLGLGDAMMEILPHTIPIRSRPEFTLKVLNNVLNRVIITKTQRGEAQDFADLILDFFEKQAI